MTEETAPVEEQDTPQDPSDSGPVDGTPAPESTEDSQASDYEKRYNDLRPEYDRTKQEISEYKRFVEALKDPETAAEALQAFGYSLEDDEDEDTFDDDDDDWDTRFERIEQTIQQQQESAREAELAELAEAYESQELGKLDPEGNLSDDYRELVAALADDYEDDDGLPDYAAAHKALQAEFERQRKSWVSSKRAPQAPSGASASHQPDLDDEETRREWIAQQLQANDA